MLRKPQHLLAWLLALSLVNLPPLPTHATDGVLGFFTDASATDCDLQVAPGGSRTVYVVFLPDGATRGGIRGVEFRVDASDADGYMLRGESPLLPNPVTVGSAIGDGVSISTGQCQTDIAIPIISFQVVNLGSGAPDASLRIDMKASPSSPSFRCNLANLCDSPNFTKICVLGGRGVLNPTQPVACGDGAVKSDWSRVKALYRN